jgi:hypothetical protein
MAQGINPDRMFDKRVVQRNIRTGRATKADYEAFVSALPDLTAQIRPPEDGGDDDGFDVREAKAAARAQGGAPRASAEAPSSATPASPIPASPTPTPVAPTFAPTPVAPSSMASEAGTPAAPSPGPAPTPEPSPPDAPPTSEAGPGTPEPGAD